MPAINPPTMDLRGQRFVLDLSDDDDDNAGTSSSIPSTAVPSLASAFIGDIKERSTTPPTAPQLKSTPSGFPEHKKRTRISAFKQQKGIAKTAVPGSSSVAAVSPPARTQPTAGKRLQRDDSILDDEERRRIDTENKQRLASMSAAEIDEERQELLAALDPSLIERLLKRANLDHGRGDTGYRSTEGRPT